MGGQNSRPRKYGSVHKRAHPAIPKLMALDDELEGTIRSGAIKLLRAEFLRDTLLARLERRQDLEIREKHFGERIYLTADEAVAALRANARCIGALTYGWTSPDHPDWGGDYLRAVRCYLCSSHGAHIVACFWDFGSLSQKPRTRAEEVLFMSALAVMGDVYASALGITVMRHRTVPPRPSDLNGEVVVLGFRPAGAEEIAGEAAICSVCSVALSSVEERWHLQLCDLCFDQGHRRAGDCAFSAAAEAELRRALEVHGSIERLYWDEQRRCRVRFASHAAAEAAEAAGPFDRVAAIFTYHTPRPYFDRGWPNFESGVSIEVLKRAAFRPRLQAALRRLPPKLVDIDDVPNGNYGSTALGGEDVGLWTQDVRTRIECAFFTGRGDKAVVLRLHHEYVAKMNNAMVHTGDAIKGDYQGQFNSVGKKEGYGTYRLPNGDCYIGQYRAGAKEGYGTYLYADGNIFAGQWKDGQPDGRGTYLWGHSNVLEGAWEAGKKEGPITVQYDDGCAYVGTCCDDKNIGEGIRWSADRKEATRMLDGFNEQGTMPTTEAHLFAEALGLSVPRIIDVVALRRTITEALDSQAQAHGETHRSSVPTELYG